MSDETDMTARAGAPRWMKILLVVSLALNLLVVGMVAGFAIKGGPKWHDGPPGGAGAMHRALSEADRVELKQRMIREFRSEKGGRAAFRQEMDGLVTLLRAETFDAAAAAERMARLRDVFDGRVASAQGLLVDYWGEMSPADRAAYADRLEAEMQRRRR